MTIAIGPTLTSHDAAAHRESSARMALTNPSLPLAWRAIMPIAPILQKHLDQNVTYDVITHDVTMSSSHTAEACHVSGDRLAKAILLRRDRGYLLAVLPASHHIDLAGLRRQLGDDHVDLADEREIKPLFPDCAPGAIPPIGECYELDVFVDDSIEQQPDVYLEGGDHATLVHLDRTQFARLMAEARHGRFSIHD
jgi:Ala-tRNA(Pro) deacylase